METLTATGYGRTIEEARANAEAHLQEMIRTREESRMIGGWIAAFLIAMLAWAWALWNAILRPIAGVPVLFGAGLVIALVVGLLQAMMLRVDHILLAVALALLLIGFLLGAMVFVGLCAPPLMLRVELWEARLLARVLERSPRLGAALHLALLVAAAAGGALMAWYLGEFITGFGLGQEGLSAQLSVIGTIIALVWRCWRHPLIGRIGALRILREGIAVPRPLDPLEEKEAR
jgi:hypothetical protein